MIISDLDTYCKKRARDIFEAFKHSLVNHPFVNTEINQGIIDDCIEFEVKQVYGRKIMSKFISEAKSDKQMTYLKDRVDYYKDILINTCVDFGSNKLEKQPILLNIR